MDTMLGPVALALSLASDYSRFSVRRERQKTTQSCPSYQAEISREWTLTLELSGRA